MQQIGIGLAGLGNVGAGVFKHLALNRDLLRELAKLFFEDMPTQLAELRTAIVADDATALERAAHTLKGAVANFGAREAHQAAQDLERMGRASDLDHAPEAFSRLENQLRLLGPALDALLDEKAA